MGKISRLSWNPNYSMNIDYLDAQNRKLFDVINRHIDLYESGSSNYLQVIRHLIIYLSREFQQEHISMMIANYPGLLRHIREHRMFTDKMSEFLGRAEQNDPKLGISMLVFLTNWVRDHVANMDVQFGEFLLIRLDLIPKINDLNRSFDKKPFLRVVNG